MHFAERGGRSQGPRGGGEAASGERETLPEGGAREAAEEEGRTKATHLKECFDHEQPFKYAI